MGPPDSDRRPSPCKGDVIPLDHEPDNLLMSDWNVLKPSVSGNKNIGTLSGLKLTFARTELESCTTARTRNIAPKSVYWIEKASEILWENTRGVISQTTMEKLHNSILSNYSSHDSWGKVLNFTRAFLKYLSVSISIRATRTSRYSSTCRGHEETAKQLHHASLQRWTSPELSIAYSMPTVTIT